MSTVLVIHTGELGELLATQFEQYGLEARHSRTGEAALERALHEPPSAVVVDAELPDVGGLELAELLKAELSVPVVVTFNPTLTRGEDGEAFLARVARLDAYFTKPFRSLALIGRVAELIGQPIAPPATAREGKAPSRTTTDEDEVLLLEDVVQEVSATDPGTLDLISQVDERPVEEGGPTEEDSIELEDFDFDIDAEVEPRDAGEHSAAKSLTEFVSESASSDPSTLALLWRRVQEQQAAAPPAPPPSRPRMGAQAGGLTPRVLTETLDAFHQSQTTGEIWLTRGDKRRVLLLSGGSLVGARSNVPDEELPSLVVRRRALSLAQVKEARALVQAGKSRSFVEALLELGMIREKRLRALLSERVRRVVCGAFTWRDGGYKVTYEGHGDREPIKVRVPVADALVRAILLTESMEALRRAAPDDARFAPEAGGAYGLEQLKLTDDEARLVIAMDGTKTIGDLQLLFDNVDERTLRGLASGLLQIGLLRLAGRGPAEPKRISFF